MGAAVRPKALLLDLLAREIVLEGCLGRRWAGDATDGRSWRAAYLKNTYAAQAGLFRPYQEKTWGCWRGETGLRQIRRPARCRYPELAPWPEAPRSPGRAVRRVRFGIVHPAASESAGAALPGLRASMSWSPRSARLLQPEVRAPIAWRSTSWASRRPIACLSPARPTIFTAPPQWWPVVWHNRLRPAAAAMHHHHWRGAGPSTR